MRNIFPLALIMLIACNQNRKDIVAIHKPADKNFTINILPYKGFDTALLPMIKNEIESFYHCKCTFLTEADLPSFAFYAPRNRYKADSLLSFENRFADKNNIVIGLTNKDISTRNNDIPDWGILGLGVCPGSTCVVSTYRIEKSSTSTTQFKERLIKIILHELGHNFGLPHCTNNPECLMTAAEGKIAQVDREKKWLCDKCRKKLDN